MKALTPQVFPGTCAVQILLCLQASQHCEKCWNSNGDQGLSWCWTQRSGRPLRMLSSSPRWPECVSGGILKGPWKWRFLCIQQWWDYARKCVLLFTSSWAAWAGREAEETFSGKPSRKWDGSLLCCPLIFQVILSVTQTSQRGWWKEPLVSPVQPPSHRRTVPALEQGNHGFVQMSLGSPNGRHPLPPWWPAPPSWERNFS